MAIQTEGLLKIGDDEFFEYQIPKPPKDESLIININKPSKEQRWKREDWMSVEDWAKYPIELKKQYLFRELDRRLNGVHVMIKGQPVYLTGSNYFYLQYWNISAINDDGFPDFRWSNSKSFYVIDYCDKDPKSYGCLMTTNKRDGKALDLKTPMPTPDGWALMEDLVVGDLVFAGDLTETKVTYISPIYFNHDCYEVMFSCGGSVVADAAHRWKVNWLEGMDKNIEVVTTTEVLFHTYASSQRGRPSDYYIKDTRVERYPVGRGNKLKARAQNAYVGKRFITNIKKVPTRPVRCIQVEHPDHTYICGKDFILTHNTERHIADLYNKATLLDKNGLYGMQSLNATEAKNNLFKDRLMRSHKIIPPYLKPISNETDTRKEIVSELTFLGRKNEFGEYVDALNNKIDWRPTKASAYQGKRPKVIFIDEPGTIEEMDLIEAWTTIKRQLSITSNIQGKAYLPTTLENMTNRGATAYLELWKQSDRSRLNKNGQTESGFYRYFKKYSEGLENFIDEYGFDKKEAAEEWHSNELSILTGGKARKFKRQFPGCIDDVFDLAMSNLLEDDVKAIIKEADDRITKNPVKYKKLFFFEEGEALKYSLTDDDNGVTIFEEPMQGFKYVIGVDPVSTSKELGFENGSNFSFTVMKGFGMHSDTYREVAEYCIRPNKMEDCYKQLLLTCIYYSKYELCQCLGESNVGQGQSVYLYFKARGRLKHMMKTGNNFWLYRDENVIERQVIALNRFIRHHGHKLRSAELVKELPNVQKSNTDRSDSYMMAILALKTFEGSVEEKKEIYVGMPQLRTIRVNGQTKRVLDSNATDTNFTWKR